MLEELTKEQERIIYEKTNEWLTLFYSLKFDKKKCLNLIKFIYEDIMKWTHPDILIFDNPMECQIASNFLNYIINEVDNNILNIEAKVGAKVGAKVRDKVGAKVGAKVGDKVRDKVRD